LDNFTAAEQEQMMKGGGVKNKEKKDIPLREVG
jgi:hypothetical protein